MFIAIISTIQVEQMARTCYYIVLTVCVILVALTLLVNIKYSISIRNLDTRLKTFSNPQNILASQNLDIISHNNGIDSEMDTELHTVLKQRASRDNLIVLSLVDSGYVDMAINLYQTSFRKYNIENYLFVGSDSNICPSLWTLSITCFEYLHVKDSILLSSYRSKAFNRKTHLKTKMVLEALSIGLRVVMVDADIVFLKNPLPLLSCQSCDAEFSKDGERIWNSGFYLACPKPATIKLFNTAWLLAKPNKHDQETINPVINNMLRKKEISINSLSLAHYPNGKLYFEIGARMFKGDNHRDSFIIVHNNWIKTGSAKTYRFKESGLWANDQDGYYSDAEGKYLRFGLPDTFSDEDSRNVELNALKNALVIGAILDRVVILPQFHCQGCQYNKACNSPNARCTLGTFYKMQVFDSYFKGRYRESVFLQHELVPINVKASQSSSYLIVEAAKKQSTHQDIQTRTPYYSNGGTTKEILEWFGDNTKSVLVFHSLYNAFNFDSDHQKVTEIMYKLTRAFNESDYRQYSG